MTRLARIRRTVNAAPNRWVTSAALWWIGPLPPLKTTFDPPAYKHPECTVCHRDVDAWRKYADGRIVCLSCAIKVG